MAFSLLLTTSSAGFADTFTVPIDPSSGNASFGRNDAVGSFVDTYTVALAGWSWFLTSSASTSASGTRQLHFTSLTILDSANAIVATDSGNLGNDANGFFALPPIQLAAGAHQIVVTGLNSDTQASRSGTAAITAVP